MILTAWDLATRPSPLRQDVAGRTLTSVSLLDVYQKARVGDPRIRCRYYQWWMPLAIDRSISVSSWTGNAISVF